jgi:hypothetical protein
MSSATSRRDPTVATNKSKGTEKRQWSAHGFVFDLKITDPHVRTALTDTYPHSGGKTNPRARIHGNVTHLFRYIHFFRRFYGNKTARLLHAATEDLKLKDSYVWGQIFNLYCGARQACPNKDYTAPDAPLTDQVMCVAVDRVLSLDPVDHDLTDEDKKDLDDLRKKWKTTVFQWKQQRNAAEPYLPNGDNWLMQLLEPPAPAQDVEMEDAPDLATDAGTVAVQQSPQFCSPDDPEVSQWFVDIVNLIKSDPEQAVQVLEDACLYARFPHGIKVLCYDLGKATYDEIQAKRVGSWAMQRFTTGRDLWAQKAWNGE